MIVFEFSELVYTTSEGQFPIAQACIEVAVGTLGRDVDVDVVNALLIGTATCE